MQVDTILAVKGTAVHTILDSASIADAVGILNERRIGAVVVTGADGLVAGILSERDIVRHLAGDPAGLLSRPVASIMSARVISTTRSASIADVMALMTNNRIRHMPVIEAGHLVGILSIGDVVKWKIEDTEREAVALREYIAS